MVVDDLLDFVDNDLSSPIDFVDGELDEGLLFPELPEESNAVGGGYIVPMLPGNFSGEPFLEELEGGYDMLPILPMLPTDLTDGVGPGANEES